MKDFINSARGKAIVVTLTMLTVLGVTAGPTLAVDTIPADPLGGQASLGYNEVAGWLMSVGIPALVIATVFGIIVRVGFKYLRKIGNRAA